jgi:phospholipid/cholesterol/gamma-HCH transport system substrate-binding protein
VGRVAAGEGTLGRLSRDTTLYSEAVAAIRRMSVLLDDVKANPRKYFQFSVF